MPATDYSKWDKFAGDLHSDTESEEEAEFGSNFTEKKGKYLHIPAKAYIPGGKKKLCELMEELPDFDPKKITSQVEQHRGFTVESAESIKASFDNLFLKQFSWKCAANTFLPGYNVASQERLLWRVWFDDCFLQNQTTENPAARSLIGSKALGSFVVGCMDRDSGEDIAISKKQDSTISPTEVADLVYKRSEGGDAEKIEGEIRDHAVRMAQLKEMGMETQEMGLPK